MRKFLACLLVVTASGCPDVSVDPGEGSDLPPIDGPTVEFDPANSIIPFPNNLVLCQTGTDATGAPCTMGKLAIPPAACESATAKQIRTQVLNKLDGFGTFEAAMQVTFTEAVDETTLTGNIVMYQRAKGAMSNDPTSAHLVPTKLVTGSALRFDPAACATPASINAVNIIPLVPLDEKSTYTVAVLQGVKTADGKDFIPSFTWALVRQKTDPVTVVNGMVTAENTPLDPSDPTDANGNGIPDSIEQLLSLDGLWKAEAQGLAFLDATGTITDRSKVLLAWEVTTQTTTDPLDPTVPNSPAATLATTPFIGTQSLTCNYNAVTCPNGIDRVTVGSPYQTCTDPATAAGNTQCFMKVALGVASGATGAAIYPTGAVVCGQVGCAAIGDVLAAGLQTTTQLQVPGPNALSGGAMIPGAWSDPVAPASQGNAILQVLIFVPVTAGPYPTVVFGHGLGSSKSALIAFAPQLAASPLHFASVAIDDVASGSRAVQISNDASIGCSGTPDPTAAGQCFQQIFSTDLAQTRDNFRQTILDMQRLTLAAKACVGTACASADTAAVLNVDPAHIVYAGQSLGGILGSTTFSVAADLKSAVLNVAAMGWVDILENTNTLEFNCPIVDALIDDGIIMGDKWNGLDTGATGLCTTPAWKAQPGYQQFASTARWILDPADGANFSSKLAPKKFILQEVVGDIVVPNYATDNDGALVGLTPGMADLFVPVCASGTNAGMPCADDTACPASKCLADPSAAAEVTSTAWVRLHEPSRKRSLGLPGQHVPARIAATTHARHRRHARHGPHADRRDHLP